MAEYIVALAFGTPDAGETARGENTNTLDWGDASEMTVSNLYDTTEVQSSISLVKLNNGVSTTNTPISAGGVDGSGDAAWVLGWMNAICQGVPNAPNKLEFEFRGLTPGDLYIVETNGIRSSGTGTLHTTVNNADELSHAINQNLTLTNKHAAVAADVNGIVTWQAWAESDAGYIAAVRLIESAPTGPVVSLGTGTYNPGSTISGTYANFTGVPTGGPLSITSGGVTHSTDDVDPFLTNLVWGTDTVDGNGKHSGTWSVDLGDLPAQGNSAKGLPFSDSAQVTITDPGA